jgi:integration host factor subunit beta
MQKSMFMDKLITNLAARFPDLTEDDISLSVETIIDAMSTRLISGGRIELRGFGSFSLNAQIFGVCRDKTLETNAEILESPLVIFKPGQVISERMNNID